MKSITNDFPEESEEKIVGANGEKISNKSPYEKETELYLGEFDAFRLSEGSKNELRGYFRFIFQTPLGIHDIPYRFIVQAETYDTSYDFANKLVEVVGKILGKSLNVGSYSELDFLEKPDRDKLMASDAIVVGPCISNEQYYPTDDDSSNDKARKRSYDRTWDKIIRYFDMNPRKLLILTIYWENDTSSITIDS